VRSCRLGRRIYRDRLELHEEADGQRRYRIYGEDPSYHQEEGTDFAAVAAGCIAVTPLHFDLTATEGLEALAGFELGGLLEPVEREIEATGPAGG
jgi:5'-nucleotidase